MADAPFQRLPLIGGEHDWAFVLGRLEMLDRADAVATVVRGSGVALVLAGMASACVWGLTRANGATVAPTADPVSGSVSARRSPADLPPPSPRSPSPHTPR